MKDMKVIKVVTLIVIIILMALMLSRCASVRRMGKSINSDINNGIKRTITAYDYNGNEIKSWSGKYDIGASEEGGKVVFDGQDGKRTTIYNGIVITEEQE